MFGEPARELAHRIRDALDFFRSHAAGYVNRKHNRHRARRAFNLFDIERSNRTLNAVLEQLEIFFREVANQPPLGIRDCDINGDKVSVDLDDVLRFRFSRQRAPWAFLVRGFLLCARGRQQPNHDNAREEYS